MSSSNCCFMTCIQISQEAGQVVWYSHLFQNFPQFIVIHTVKGFGIVNKAEIGAFLELSCISMIQWMLAIWSLILLPFRKPAWTSGISRFMKPVAAAAAMSLQLCPTLCDPIDGSPPGFSIPGILQARTLEWVAISFSKGSSWSRDRTQVSCIVGRRFTIWATREVQSRLQFYKAFVKN